MSNVINVNEKDFDDVVIKSKLPVVVDYWSTTCQPCKILAPILERLADAYAGKILIVKVCANENVEMVERHEIFSVPTLQLYFHGEMVHSQVGLLPDPALRMLFDEFLKGCDMVE